MNHLICFSLIVLPLALVAFMESFSVAHRIASQKNELHFLNASQELFANGGSTVFPKWLIIADLVEN